METVRALVLAMPPASGRPWSNTGAGPKPLVPVATRPIVFHTLDALSSAGIGETVLVTDAASMPQFRAAIGDGGQWDMAVSYAEAGAGGDVCSALDAAGPFAGDGVVVAQRADALLGDRLRDDMAEFQADRLDALGLMVARRHAPAHPAIGGCWLFRPHAIKTLLGGPWPGDPMLALRRHGAQVRTRAIDGCLACNGGESTLLRANRHALERLRSAHADATLVDCEIQGPVVIHPTAVLEHTLVRGPAIVGAGARLSSTYIGPYTSIGAGARLEGTEIEHSIVMEAAMLLNVDARLETSIIGRGASIVRRFEMPRAVRVSIGDGAEVALS